MKTCKFELLVRNTGLFHCAADVNGWAELYTHEEFESPCPHCKKRVAGKPTVVDHELKSAEFWEIAGELITEEDWNRFMYSKYPETHRCKCVLVTKG